MFYSEDYSQMFSVTLESLWTINRKVNDLSMSNSLIIKGKTYEMKRFLELTPLGKINDYLTSIIKINLIV